MATLSVRNLTKAFDGPEGEIVAVEDLDLEIQDGEFLVLVGPSGCGKSTTLRCIAGLESLTEGQILLDDDEVTNREPKNRDMAMVFQSYALYPHMTARENMSFGLRMTADLSKEEINERVEDTAETLGISELLEKKPDALSGGQQQRVALGRAIVRDPSVFLMDEPLSNLDAKLRSQMRTELQDLQQKLGVTTIYVTHDQTEAMTMGDRIAVLNQGELQQIGSPEECYHQPANQFVAGFIGEPSMNFLPVTYNANDQILNAENFSYTLSGATGERIEDQGNEFILGIRPEAIDLADPDEVNAIEATVNVTEPLGNVLYLYIDVGTIQLTASVDGDADIEVGQSIHITFSEMDLHLFDRETGKSVKGRDKTVKAEPPT